EAAAVRRAEEEAQAAATRRAEEEATARQEAEAAAARQAEAERQAAELRRQAEEEAAAARQAEEKAQAAATRRAEEEATARQVEAERQAAELRRQAAEEAAAARRAEEEAQAAALRHAEEEATARQEAEAAAARQAEAERQAAELRRQAAEEAAAARRAEEEAQAAATRRAEEEATARQVEIEPQTVETTSASNDDGEGKTAISAVSDFLDTHVISPMSVVFGLNPSNEVAANNDDQGFEQVDLHPATSELGESVSAPIPEPVAVRADAPENEVFDPTAEGEHDVRLGLSSSFTAHADGLDGKKHVLTDGENFTDTLIDDGILSLYDYDEKPSSLKSHEDSLYQLSSLLSEKESTSEAENPFLQESDDLSSAQVAEALAASENALSTSQDELSSLHLTTDYSHIDMTPQETFYQLSALLSGKKPIYADELTYRETSVPVIRVDVLNPVLVDIQDKTRALSNFTGLYYQLHPSEFEKESKKLQDSQKKVAALTKSLVDKEAQANGDQNFLDQMEQVKKGLQVKAQQLVDLQKRMDYVQSTGQLEVNGKNFEEFSSSLTNLASSLKKISSNTLSASENHGDSSLSAIQMRVFARTVKLLQNDFYKKVLTLGLRDTFTFNRIGEGIGLSYDVAYSALPKLLDFARSIKTDTVIDFGNDLNSPTNYMKVLSSIFNASVKNEEQKQSSAQIDGSPVEVATDDDSSIPSAALFSEQTETGEMTSQHPSPVMELPFVTEADEMASHHPIIPSAALVSEQTETGEMTSHHPSPVTDLPFEIEVGGTGSYDPIIPSATLVSEETEVNGPTSSSTPPSSVSFVENSKFGEFSINLAALKGLFEGNLARLGTLEDIQKDSRKGRLTARVVKSLQNNFYDQTQTLELAFQPSFERFEDARVLSYDEALSALPQLVEFASKIEHDTGINLYLPTFHLGLLNTYFGQFVKILEEKQTLSSAQIEGSSVETATGDELSIPSAALVSEKAETDAMTSSSTSIHSASSTPEVHQNFEELVSSITTSLTRLGEASSVGTATDVMTSSSTSIPSASPTPEMKEDFGKFASSAAALTSFVKGNSDRLSALADSESISVNKKRVTDAVTMLQNNLYDKAQALKLGVPFTRIGKENELSYSEALFVLPQLLSCATNIKFWTIFAGIKADWQATNIYITALSRFLNHLIGSSSSDQAQ
ncbi:MAG: hypothetical protein K2X02_03015, partial [Alphaproteobacteria bacterium]|nr:hypothetical protein [Alphaproteobacteria bacterium]